MVAPTEQVRRGGVRQYLLQAAILVRTIAKLSSFGAGA